MSRPADKSVIQAKLNELATCLREKRYDEFPSVLADIKHLEPRNPDAIHFEGLFALRAENNAEKAHALVSQAAEMLPDSSAINHNLATIKINRGDFAQAERLLIRAIQKKPDYAEAYHTLAGIRKFKAGDSVTTLMERLATSKKLNPEDRSFIFFALAKAYDDVGRYADAWNALEQGNRLIKETYDPTIYERGLSEVERIFTSDFIAERAEHGYPAQAPIFIVGMPRSGTTLLETILGRNPLIRNAGELPALPALARQIAKQYGSGTREIGSANVAQAVPDGHLFRWGEGYMNFAHERIGKWAEYFTDKLPDNSFNLGLAAILLPNAKFIHIRRDPMDIALSIYFQRFTSLPYGFSPESIVAHFKYYRRAMDHWHKVLPKDRLLEVDYEDLVEDPDGFFEHVHNHLKIAQYVGSVPKVPDTHSVTTASRWQARQPIYKTSKQKWRRYEAQMLATSLADLAV